MNKYASIGNVSNLIDNNDMIVVMRCLFIS